VYLEDSSPLIENSFFSDNREDGLYAEGASYARVVNNAFSMNDGSCIHAGPDLLSAFSGNTGSGNGMDGITIRGGTVRSDDVIWKAQDLPFVVAENVTVRHTETDGTAAVLTIEPGAEVRFEPGAGLYVGYSGCSGGQCGDHLGALSAVGMPDAMILFTSNGVNPAPGDWKGIYFRDQAVDEDSRLEQCIIEYGGFRTRGNVCLDKASPAIFANIIRAGVHSGVFANDGGSSSAVITCNTFAENVYGIYTENGALPAITENSFLANLEYGIYQADGSLLSAENNWWGDPAGPGQGGDGFYGNVDAVPYLTARSDCAGIPAANAPPFTPAAPRPADAQTRVPLVEEGNPVPVILSWSCTDPNPADTLFFDVQMGTGPESLGIAAQNLENPEFAVPGLGEGSTLYWKITARDPFGAETEGPVWSFTTQGSPPDLVVSDVSLSETRISAGDTVTMSAEIANSGEGPAVDGFQVEFAVDGTVIGTAKINATIHAGESRSVESTWTAPYGDHALTVSADTADTVPESQEENNSRTVELPSVEDLTAPRIVSTYPADGSHIAATDHIIIVLEDNYGEIDTPAVAASLSMESDAAGSVPGRVSVSGGTFTFTPAELPLPEGTYTVTLVSSDTAGNSRPHTVMFIVDRNGPPAPVVTGGSVASGPLAPRPARNESRMADITLEGSREPDTWLYINGKKRVAPAAVAEWSLAYTLAEGENHLEIWLVDEAGNRGPSVLIDVLLDTAPPSVSGTIPEDNAFLAASPDSVVISVSEAGAGISFENCSRSLSDSAGRSVNGVWELNESGHILFHPAAALPESAYTLALTLEDRLGNRGPLEQYSFTVDTTAPPVPGIDPVVSPTHNPGQTLSGTREAHAAVFINNEEVSGHTAGTTWQHTAALSEGANPFSVTAVDRAGNESPAAFTEIVFDNIAPSPVDTLTADGEGDGKSVALDWTGYDESLHGDIDHYRIYRGDAEFESVSEMGEPLDTVSAGAFTHAADDLVKGEEYWFAVVAVDASGLYDATVTSVSATVVDVIAPHEVTKLSVEPLATGLVFSWSVPENTPPDLAGYRVFFDDDAEGVLLSSDRLSWEAAGLEEAASYPVCVKTVDADGNESSGISLMAATLLDNPADLSAEAFDGHVKLSWAEAAPEELVLYYAVYAAEEDFPDITGMSPVVTTTNPSAGVAGLTNGTPFYFAVATVNISDGSRPGVATVSATPQKDESGPDLVEITFDHTPVSDGYTLTRSGTFRVSASDAAGVSSISFYLDDVLIAKDYNAPFQCYLDILDFADGSHTLRIEAADSLGNLRSTTYTLHVELAAPPAPVIESPADGTLTCHPEIEVTGTAEPDSQLLFFIGESEAGGPVQADPQGRFTARITLSEGENPIRARSENRAGSGSLSTPVTVTLDTAIPEAPTGLTAVSEEGGKIRLSWRAADTEDLSGYHLYRSTAAFSEPSQAGRLTETPVASAAYLDLPDTDGAYHYRAAAVSRAGSRGALSRPARAVSDSTRPFARSVTYAPSGAQDPETGAMAPGRVEVFLEVSEPLFALPFLSITPEGGTPIPVSLTRTDGTNYAGAFAIEPETLSGTAWAVFSARDRAGNRGTRVHEGRSIRIDTRAPEVIRLSVFPAPPINNDEQTTVTAVLGLDEALPAGAAPDVGFRLSGADSSALPVDVIRETTGAQEDAQAWQAEFTLPAQAGLEGPEILSFTYSATDHLGNTGSVINAENAFQVYQGALPPLASPAGLSGTALPGGDILLQWEAVEDAAGYRLYRRGPGDEQFVPCGEPAAANVQSVTDTPEADGIYSYTVASIREENGESAESAKSPPVAVRSDSQAPPAPMGLALDLAANGIHAAWETPVYTEGVTFLLYRSEAEEIVTLDGLSPVIEGIGQESTSVVDPNPSPSAHTYAVAARDEAGNISAPSNSAYLNFDLLPVKSLAIEQTDLEAPLVSWTHAGAIAGCHLYLGTGEERVRLNQALITAGSYTDTGYTGDGRT
jgi:fibronectin type 3 domain-containing protein